MTGREWRARRRRPPCTRAADSFERARRNYSEVRGSAERVWRRGLWRPIIIRRRDGSPRFRPTMVLMPTLGDVFRELNALKEERIVADYALGGATAMLFYAEPTRTYDVDVFVLLARAEGSALVSMCRGYEDCRRHRRQELPGLRQHPGVTRPAEADRGRSRIEGSHVSPDSHCAAPSVNAL